jgi:hypothetical protein
MQRLKDIPRLIILRDCLELCHFCISIAQDGTLIRPYVVVERNGVVANSHFVK